ncbi:hypothetical protein D3C75_1209640 [compost metagenome]
MFRIKHGGFSITSVMQQASIRGSQQMRKWIGSQKNILTRLINTTAHVGNLLEKWKLKVNASIARVYLNCAKCAKFQ